MRQGGRSVPAPRWGSPEYAYVGLPTRPNVFTITLSATQSQAISTSNALINKTISITQAQSPQILKATTKSALVTQGQNVSLLKSTSKTLIFGFGPTPNNFTYWNRGFIYPYTQGKPSQGTEGFEYWSRGFIYKGAFDSGVGQSQTISVSSQSVHNNTLTLTATQGQTPTVQKAITRTPFTLTQGQNVALIKSAGKNLPLTQAQNISVSRAQAKTITLTQGQNISIVKARPLSLSTSQGQSPSLTKRAGITLTINGTLYPGGGLDPGGGLYPGSGSGQAQVITLSEIVGHALTLNLTQSQTLSVIKGITKKMSLITQGQNITVLKTVNGHTLSLTQAQVVHLTNLPNKNYLMTQPQSPHYALSVNHILNLTQAQVVHLTAGNAPFLTLSLTQGQSPSMVKTAQKILLMGIGVIGLNPDQMTFWNNGFIYPYMLNGVVDAGNFTHWNRGFMLQGAEYNYVSTSQPTSASVSSQNIFAKVFPLPQSQIPTLIKAMTKAISLTANQNISVNKLLTPTLVLTQGQILTLDAIKAGLVNLTLVQGQSIEEDALVNKMLTTSQTQSPRVIKRVNTRLITSQGQSINVSHGQGHVISLSTTQGQSITRFNQALKPLALSQSQNIAAGLLPGQLIQLTQDQSISRADLVSLARSLTQGQNVSLNNQASHNKLFNLTQASIPSVSKQAARQLLLGEVAIPTLNKGYFVSESLTQANTITMSTFKFRGLIFNLTQGVIPTVLFVPKFIAHHIQNDYLIQSWVTKEYLTVIGGQVVVLEIPEGSWTYITGPPMFEIAETKIWRQAIVDENGDVTLMQNGPYQEILGS